jgi:hypothetical protein
VAKTAFGNFFSRTSVSTLARARRGGPPPTAAAAAAASNASRRVRVGADAREVEGDAEATVRIYFGARL